MPLDVVAAASVQRRALRFGEGLFGWYHEAEVGPRDAVAVLCPPVGPEYTRSHRTLRHLADRLALAGIPALRFDYHGVGDSAGDEDDPDRVGHWRASVAAAVREARRISGRGRVCLVGVRLGATLAALEAGPVEADLLVLWGPVVKGRAFTRELRAMAMTAGTAPAPTEDGTLESAGLRVSPETLEALGAIDLAKVAFPARARVLIVDRDDLPGDETLPASLARQGIAHERITTPGWNGMMADHQFTVVPEEALAAIHHWIATRDNKPGTVPGQAPGSGLGQSSAAARLELEGIEEAACHFGPDGRLFGIVARPTVLEDKSAVLLLNAGSIHHTGPHRLYVRMARALARRGHVVLRFDFEGIGDSVTRGAARENHPYNQNTLDDLEAAMDFLRTSQGCERFALVGVCSGAYHAYHAGFRIPDAPIERVVLVNPWTFAWREGMSLATAINHYGDVAAYEQSMRSLDRWKRLLRGEVDVLRIVRTVAAQLQRRAKGWLFEAPLAKELREIEKLGRRVHLVLSDGEPAHAILSTEAPRTLRRGLRKGSMTFDRLRGGDHTFSRSVHRAELTRLVERILGSGST